VNVPAEKRIETAERAKALMAAGHHCSEAFFMAVGDALLDSVDEGMIRMTTGLGGGVGGSHQEMCGALSAALLVIGAVHGRVDAGQDDAHCYELCKQYLGAFEDRFGSRCCGELLETRYGGDKIPCSQLVTESVGVFFDVVDN
jgi:C_GCAxxG_C_C family probable redox protein